MKQPVKVAIIEDHPEYRELVALLLEDEDEIALEWQFGSAEWALRRLSSDQGKKLPDVITGEDNQKFINRFLEGSEK